MIELNKWVMIMQVAAACSCADWFSGKSLLLPPSGHSKDLGNGTNGLVL